MEKYTVGLQLLILGMGTVLLTLYLLSLILRLTGHIFGPKNRTSAPDKEDGAGEKGSSSGTKDRQTAKIEEREQAAAAAAIYAYLSQEEDRDYRIISIKRKDSSAWKS